TLTFIALFFGFSVCAQKAIQKKIQTDFIEAQNGSTIELPAGTYQFDASLWLDDKQHVTIRGAGEDRTILSFKGQISGAEGIYVGQSKFIIVKNSKAYQNVAGIEIENSLHADVYDNEAYNNTGGILVFDLPDLIQKEGGYVRVFRNNIHDNNHLNFAPKGNT